jgi:hypothetical protein
MNELTFSTSNGGSSGHPFHLSARRISHASAASAPTPAADHHHIGFQDQRIAAITDRSLDYTKKILETYMPRTGKMAARAIVLRLERTAKPEEPAKKSLNSDSERV